jgi:hypothetical protein
MRYFGKSNYANNAWVQVMQENNSADYTRSHWQTAA